MLGSAHTRFTGRLVASGFPFTSRMSPRRGSRKYTRLVSRSAMPRYFSCFQICRSTRRAANPANTRLIKMASASSRLKCPLLTIPKVPTARADRFLTTDQTQAAVNSLPADFIPHQLRRFVRLFERRRFRQPNHLHRGRAHQPELLLVDTLLDATGQLQIRQLHRAQFVLRLERVEHRFAFRDLPSQFVQLVLLQYVTDRRSAEQQANHNGLECRSNLRPRLVMLSVLRHVKASPAHATARSALADFPSLRPRSAGLLCAAPTSSRARPAFSTPAHPPRLRRCNRAFSRAQIPSRSGPPANET